MTEPRIHVRPTRYQVCALPEGDINEPSYTIDVEYRGRDLWAVTRHSRCLGRDGTWDYEMRPSEREDDWLREHRFDLDTALELARAAAPHVTVNGHTVAEALAQAEEADPT
ncbi:hypothetical protein B4N89_20715 [Embleya scabrispora]|uniref:Uncharacterized protein n=1 Tax=Embleya scabrispora TaxID=159449 RepID=A0A1T3P1S7_9ACTN|nr:hypothetical protein [Embleya scabrispora]OPC83038.1 hypothetical protein B4N89_20715 [Embleya scabrispora]